MIWDNGTVPDWWVKGKNRIVIWGIIIQSFSEKELLNNATVIWGKCIFCY